MTKYAAIITVALLMNGCGGLEKLASCAKDITQLRAQNDISSECRQAISDLLPKPQDNLKNNIVSLGSFEQGTSKYISILGADAAGGIVDENSTIEVTEHLRDGSIKIVATSEYEIGTIDQFSIPKPAVSLSSIIDYSGSMRDGDIDDAVDIYKDIFNIFKGGMFESEIKIFSTTVERKLDFSDDTNSLKSKILRDNGFERNTTALLDAMGSGLEALHEQDSPFKLIVVTTDGIENSSQNYTSEQEIYTLTQQYHTPAVMIGALFSDVTFMKNMARQSGGIFIYAKSIKLARSRAKQLVQMIAHMVIVKIKNINSGSTYTVKVGN